MENAAMVQESLLFSFLDYVRIIKLSQFVDNTLSFLVHSPLKNKEKIIYFG
jgi:hypothetical protein